MKKSTFKKIGTMLATAIMTVACCAMNTTSASESNVSLNLTEASGVAGQCVTVNLVIESGNACTGYDVDVQFDDRLEVKNVGGVFATETIGNVTTLINLTGAAFKDGKAVSSITFELPKDANEGDVYDISFSRIGEINSDNGDFENPVAMGTTITVLESAKKVTNHKVFVTEVNGVEVSQVGLRGDADGDGQIGVYDAIKIAEKMVNRGDMDAAGEYFADVNNDSQANLYDAIAICRYMLSSDKANAWGKII